MKHDQTGFGPKSAYASQAYGNRQEIEGRITRFMPMVRKAAWHIYGSGREGLEVEDLVQAGLVALTECARKHAGPGEDGFAAYAKIRVRGAMFDLVRKLLPNSRGAAQRRKQIADKLAEVTFELGRTPDNGELAAAMGISEGELAELQSSAAPIRLTALDGEYDDANMAFADDAPQPFEIIADAELREELVRHIAELPERLKLVLQLYFVEELNLAEIAAVLDVSVPRIHQLKAQAIDRLRKLMADQAEFFG